MDKILSDLLETASSPDNLDAFLRKTLDILARPAALGPGTGLAVILGGRGKAPPTGFFRNFSKTGERRLLAGERGPAGDRTRRLSAVLCAEGKKAGVLLARFAVLPADPAVAANLFGAAAKTISARLSHEKRDAAFNLERDVSASIKHLEEFFLAFPAVSLEEISRAVLDEARRLTGSSFGFTGYIDPVTGRLILPALTAEAGEKSRVMDGPLVFKEFTGLWGWVLNHKKPLLSNFTASDRRAAGVPRGHVKIGKFLGIPALSGTKLLGILALANPRGDYSAAELETAGRLARVYAIILQRKLAEDDVREERARYQALFENANAAIFMADTATGKILDANKGAEKLTGRTREELIGMDQRELHPPGTAAYYKKQFREHTRKGRATLEEAEILRKNGSRTPAQISASKLTIGGREVLLGIFQDVSAQLRAERLLQDIVGKNPLSIQLIDGGGFTVKTNSAHTAIFGAPPPPDYSIFRDPQLKKHGFADLLERVKKGEVVHLPDIPYNAHDVNPTAPDKPLWLRAVVFPLFDGTGKPERFVLMHEDVTARRQAEEKLKETTLFNKGIIDNAMDAIVAFDSDLRYTLFNPFMEALTGIPAKDAIGRSVTEVFPHLKGCGIEERQRKLLRGMKQGRMNLKLINKKTGQDVWTSVSSYPLRNSSGKVTGIVGILRDITASKKTEEKYQALVESTDTGYLILDARGRVVDVNKEYLRLTGRRDIKEIIGHRVTEWTAPYDRARNKREVGKCLKNGFARNLCVDYIDKRGNVIPIEINANIVKTGDSFQIVSLCRDISERKLTETRLKDNEEKYRRLVENLGREYFFYRHDTKGVFDYLSPAITDMLGYSQKEFLTHYSEYLTDNPRNKEVIRYTELSIRGIQQPPYEVEIYHKDGSVHLLEVTENPLRGAAGQVIAVEGLAHDITVRKAAETALRESEEKHRIFVENSPDPKFVHAFDGKILFVNEAAVREYGYSRQEFSRMSVAALSVPQKKSRYKARSARVETTGDTTFELMQRSKSGAIFTAEVHARKGLWRGVPAVFSLCRNISARKAAEAVSKENAAVLKAQQEASPDAILVVDEKGGITSFNRNFKKLWGLPEKVMAAKSDKLALATVMKKLADPQAFLKQVEYLYRHPGEESRDEITLKDGRTIERFTAAARGKDGEYYGRTWYFRDISPRRQLENILKESEETMRTIFETATDLIFIKDREGRYLRMNKACADFFRLKPDNVLGTTDTELFPPEAAQEVEIADQEVIRAGKTITRTYTREGHSGKYTHHIIKSPLRNAAGEITGVLGVVRDITQLKKMEAELALARAAEAVGREARPMAHDINNALAAINGYATMIDDDLPGTNPIKMEIEQIIKAVKRAAEITSKLQDFARNPKLGEPGGGKT